MAFSFSPHVRTYLSAKRRGSRPVLDGDGHAQRGDVLRTNCGGGEIAPSSSLQPFKRQIKERELELKKPRLINGWDVSSCKKHGLLWLL